MFQLQKDEVHRVVVRQHRQRELAHAHQPIHGLNHLGPRRSRGQLTDHNADHNHKSQSSSLLSSTVSEPHVDGTHNTNAATATTATTTTTTITTESATTTADANDGRRQKVQGRIRRAQRARSRAETQTFNARRQLSQ